MKREIYIYSILGIFTCLLLYFQFNWSDKELKSTSSIQELKGMNQLTIDFRCNVFLVEGEDEFILIEGPAKKIRQIETFTTYGCVKIRENKKTLLAGIFNLFIPEPNDINIYITVNDLNIFKLSYIDEESNIKFNSIDCLGLILMKGEKLMIESKQIKSCV